MWKYEPVPCDALHLFRMVWQLETWLRTIVYVELRAHKADWETPIKSKGGRNWPPDSLAKDKRLHHMATPHQAALSYLTFGQLWDIIRDAAVWPFFEPYFPPKANVEPRIEEIKSIRNRVAHFREPHATDVARMDLFMRDMESGVRKFCSRYTTGIRLYGAGDDPVTELLEVSWSGMPCVEMIRPNGNWLYAEPDRMRVHMHANLATLAHQTSKSRSLDGVVYSLSMRPAMRDKIDSVSFVESTKQLHQDIIHILLSDNSDEIGVTVPAIHGPEKTAELLEAFITAGLNCCTGSHYGRTIESAHAFWPEYILRPNHMLTFFDADMLNPVLDVSE